jgi:5-methylthioadenosine/S-adenosylhomocysteine deaminase
MVINMKILIKNGLVHQFEGGHSAFSKKDILIRDSIIERIDEFIEPEGVDTVIDASDDLVLPGLVNAHLHSHDHFNKGAIDNLPLEFYLLYLRPFYEGINASPEEIYIRTLYGCIEMIKTGTTTIIDDVIFSPFINQEGLDSVMAAYNTVGLRGYVAAHVLNKPIYETIPYLNQTITHELKEQIQAVYPSIDAFVEFFESNIEKYNKDQNTTHFTMAPSGPQRCSIELMMAIKTLSDKYHIPAVSHILESKMQKEAGPYLFRKSLIEYLDEHDLLYPNLNSVHSVQVTPRDIELLEKNKCKVIHNPGSNLKLGSGIAPIREFLSRNISVALGTDNISANDSINMIDTMKLAGLIHKIGSKDYNTWIGAEEVFKMATQMGAEAALLEDQIGDLKVGKKADLILVDTNNERFLPSSNLINNLVYAETGESVHTVIINGKIIMKDKKILTFDERDVLHKVKEMEQKIKDELARSKEQAKEIHIAMQKAYDMALKEWA